MIETELLRHQKHRLLTTWLLL